MTETNCVFDGGMLDCTMIASSVDTMRNMWARGVRGRVLPAPYQYDVWYILSHRVLTLSGLARGRHGTDDGIRGWYSLSEAPMMRSK